MEKQTFKERLPHGFAQRIADRLGVTPPAVSRFLTGKTNSHRIEQEVLRVIACLEQNRKRALNGEEPVNIF